MTWTSSANTFGYPLIYAPHDVRDDDEAEGAAGVREPRRPIQPSHSDGEALALPHHDDAPPAYLTIIGGF